MFKNLLKKRNQSGFTIIEVMIVLAIAGLILVVVLIAVPQLQRNQRNSARKADAARVASTAGNIVANNNGTTFGTNATDITTLRSELGSLSQITNLASVTVVAGAGAGNTDPSTMVIRTGVKCGPNGTAVATAGRSFVVLYSNENSSSTDTTNGTPLCIES